MIERNDESELKQKLPSKASRDNGIKMDVVCCIKAVSLWSCGKGTGLSIQESQVQNHYMTPRLAQPFILQRSIK